MSTNSARAVSQPKAKALKAGVILETTNLDFVREIKQQPEKDQVRPGPGV